MSGSRDGVTILGLWNVTVRGFRPRAATPVSVIDEAGRRPGH